LPDQASHSRRNLWPARQHTRQPSAPPGAQSPLCPQRASAGYRWLLPLQAARPAGRLLGGSCTSSLRRNTRGLPRDRYRDKTAPPSGPLWRHSSPLHREDTLDTGRTGVCRHLRPPPIAVSYHHGVLTLPLAAAMAARGNAIRLADSRHDRLAPRPSEILTESRLPPIHANSSSRALASCRSRVSKPSVNQP
jgi:hypothetical protein